MACVYLMSSNIIYIVVVLLKSDFTSRVLAIPPGLCLQAECEHLEIWY